MKIWIYKRTHNGDPDAAGCFGSWDCMGAARGRDYDAVIGVGGIGAEAVANGIAGQLNWIGIGPHRIPAGKRGPHVFFDHFLDYGTDGPMFRTLAPRLAERLYVDNVRSLLRRLNVHEQAEAWQIVQRAIAEPPSPGLRAAGAQVVRQSL